MSWKERVKNLGEWSEREGLAGEARRAAAQEERDRSEKERKQAISEYMPRVREVCEEFARAIGVKTEVRVETYNPYDIPYVDVFAPEREPFTKGSIRVTIFGGPISDPGSQVRVETKLCTDWLFEKCRNQDISKASQGYGLRGVVTENRERYSSACYVIPLCDFTEDKLAAVLEEFCRHGMVREARWRP